jgi:hypothetical protein
MASSSSNVVGVHYRVGKKIGEGSFGVIFEGTNLLNNQQVAIKFVCALPGKSCYACGRETREAGDAGDLMRSIEPGPQSVLSTNCGKKVLAKKAY